MALTRDDLLQLLAEQLELLDLHCERFDSGRRVTSLSLSTTIRVLVHDTSSSHSVLGSLGVKETMRFLDASDYQRLAQFSKPGDRRVQGSEPGLVAAFFPDEGDPYFIPRFETPEPDLPERAFEDWWQLPTMSDDSGYEFSRRNLVLTVANKAGGAHVDRMGTSAVFNDLARKGSLGFWTVNGRVLASPVPPAIRQIAEELRLAIRAAFAEELGELATHPFTPPVHPPGFAVGSWSVSAREHE
ncbi:hypothetical protein [Microbacterium sp. NPDC087592]|uniref:hypothetical protein n=1 Tax=Microbacterium sp. NPDC087592 TaxID=3364193 RepID=UPI00380DE2D7